MSGPPSLLELLQAVERARDSVHDEICFDIEFGARLVSMRMRLDLGGSGRLEQQAVLTRGEIEHVHGSVVLMRIEAMGESIRRQLGVMKISR